MPFYQGSYRANQKHRALHPRAFIAPRKVRFSTDQLNSLPVASTMNSTTPKDKAMNLEEEKQSVFLAGIDVAANRPATESPAVIPHQPTTTDIEMEVLSPSGNTGETMEGGRLPQLTPTLPCLKRAVTPGLSSPQDIDKQTPAKSSSLSSLNSKIFDTSSDDEPLAEVAQPKPRRERRAPYIDQFGLRHPMPPSNLYRGYNTDRHTGRRVYNKEARQLLPFHHDPVVRCDRRWRSTSAIDALLDIHHQVNEAADRVEKHGTDERTESEIGRLFEVERFVLDTDRLREWDESPRNRSLEDRMEDLLKEYGYDRMKPTDYELRRMRMDAMEH
ncbi:MAG: hypothetical protein L6R37_005269 [Teloschistes peruensis]|nr:MAG: hypothetical protein L6R37_005269 [Teloschistes peruensis]